VMINGTLVAGIFLGNSSDDEGLGLACLPFVIGVGLIVAAYRAFRYGEEVEKIESGARKAGGSRDKQSKRWFGINADVLKELADLGKASR
jgi:hypothetical protein